MRIHHSFRSFRIRDAIEFILGRKAQLHVRSLEFEIVVHSVVSDFRCPCHLRSDAILLQSAFRCAAAPSSTKTSSQLRLKASLRLIRRRTGIELKLHTREPIQSSEGRAHLELDNPAIGAWLKHIGCELIPFVIDAEKEAFLMLQRPLKKHLVALPGISKAEPL